MNSFTNTATLAHPHLISSDLDITPLHMDFSNPVHLFRNNLKISGTEPFF